jgi:hypothetical protein
MSSYRILQLHIQPLTTRKAEARSLQDYSVAHPDTWLGNDLLYPKLIRLSTCFSHPFFPAIE